MVRTQTVEILILLWHGRNISCNCVQNSRPDCWNCRKPLWFFTGGVYSAPQTSWLIGDWEENASLLWPFGPRFLALWAFLAATSKISRCATAEFCLSLSDLHMLKHGIAFIRDISFNTVYMWTPAVLPSALAKCLIVCFCPFNFVCKFVLYFAALNVACVRWCDDVMGGWLCWRAACLAVFSWTSWSCWNKFCSGRRSTSPDWTEPCCRRPKLAPSDASRCLRLLVSVD